MFIDVTPVLALVNGSDLSHRSVGVLVLFPRNPVSVQNFISIEAIIHKLIQFVKLISEINLC